MTEDDYGLPELVRDLRHFVSERNWERFHTPKNLVLALVGEVGELAEIIQWLSADEAEAVMQRATAAEHTRNELADVFIYLVRLGDVLGVDLPTAARDKLKLNAERYPAAKTRGLPRPLDESE
jgi:dCTP diphosphatase